MEVFFTNFKSAGVFTCVLSVLIIVHEWGHFITAKRLGVMVERFALGFGPKVFAKTYNGTEYRINLIPLGGYVKMAGDERSEVKGRPEEFYSKPIWARSLIVINGPVLNFIFAYFCFALVFMLGFPGISTRVNDVVSGGPAHQAGLQINDKIIEIDGKKIWGWMNLEHRLQGDDTTPILVKAERAGQIIEKTVIPEIVERPDLLGQIGKVRDIGISPNSNTIGVLMEDNPAEKAGLLIGDKIIAINGVSIGGWNAIQKNVSESRSSTIQLQIIRDGKVIQKNVEAEVVTVKDENGLDREFKRIGIGPEFEFDMFRFGFVASFQNAYEELSFITVMTYRALYTMVTGKQSAKESVTGPIGIFYIVKSAAEEGLSHILFIMGVISASLAIFNLLPVIPLDGGHLFLYGIEKVRGRALSPRTDEYIARVGFSLIIVLAIFVFYTDIVGVIEGRFR